MERFVPNLGNGEISTEAINLKFIDRLKVPITLNPKEATLHDVYVHLLLRQRLKDTTAKKTIQGLQRITDHPFGPKLDEPTLENWVRYADYREQIEQAKPYSIINDWKYWKRYLVTCGIPIFTYRPPTKPGYQFRKIPMPEKVHELINLKYSDDDYKNALVQYSLMHSFLIGWRNPSEICKMKVTDIDLDDGILVITEQKKRNSTRIIAPERKLMDSHNCKSFKNWIDKWRVKVENSKSNDALYLNINGTPIKPDSYRTMLNKKVKPHCPYFSPYLTRHWCATARLVKEFVDTKHWNKNRVKNWLGHDNENTTDYYIRSAEQYHRTAPYDWIKRVLRFSMKNAGEDNPLKPILGAKMGVSIEIPPVSKVRTHGDSEPHYRSKLIDTIKKIVLSAFGLLHFFFRLAKFIVFCGPMSATSPPSQVGKEKHGVLPSLPSKNRKWIFPECFFTHNLAASHTSLGVGT